MATVVVLIEGEGPGVTLHAAAMDALGDLGVTGVTLVRDGAAVGVIVDGWAFDPASSAAVAAALGVANGGARVLFPVSQTSLSVRTTRIGAEPVDGGGRA